MTVQVEITPSGEVVLPEDVRRKLGVEAGGTLLIEDRDDGVLVRAAEDVHARAMTTAEAIRRAQEFSRKWLKNDGVDKFLAERRAMWGEE